MSTPENTLADGVPVQAEQPNTVVNDGTVQVPENERPLDPNGQALVPGTPDAQIVADRNDADVTQADYDGDLKAIVADLDDVINRLGQDLSAAVLSEFKHERIAGIGLRVALEALQGARRVIDSIQPSTGAGPAVTTGVVS